MNEFIKLLDESLNYVSHEIVGDTNFIHVTCKMHPEILPVHESDNFVPQKIYFLRIEFNGKIFKRYS